MKALYFFCFLLCFSLSRLLLPLNPQTEALLRSYGFDPNPTWMQISYADEKRAIPHEFDIRTTNRSKCIHAIPDEGKCLGSWALIPASVLADRYCIKHNGSVNVSLSGQELLNCESQGNGCKGGEVGRIPFEFLKNHGITTEECQPWVSTDGNTRTCDNHCEKGTYKSYKCANTKFLIHDDDVKSEIMNVGPVDCRFELYEDFNDYKSGIYYRVSNRRLNPNHAAKVVGWGDENQIKFWILQNSWGKKWGENEYFRMKEAECGICKIGLVCDPGDVPTFS